LLGVAEIGDGKVDSGKRRLIDGVDLLRQLYSTLPNIARFNDLLEAIPHCLDRFSQQPLNDEPAVKELLAELDGLKEQKSKVEGLITSLKIEIDSFRLDTLERMADILDVSNSEGTRNGEESTFVKAKPRTNVDRKVWNEFNSVLRKYDFEWKGRLQSDEGNSYMELYWEH